MRFSIAIVTINLNNATGLAKTLDSVRQQTRRPDAHVVVDGGSQDGSRAVLEQYHANLTKWISQPDNGVYAAQNKGWKMVKADYYLFLNSGDTLYTPQSLEMLAAAISNNRQLIYGNLMVENPDGTHWQKTYPGKLPANYFEYETLPHPATLISHCWLEALKGYDETLCICSDWKFFYEAFQKSPKSFFHVEHTISCFDTRGISSVQTNQSTIAKEKQLVRAEFLAKADQGLLRTISKWLKA